MEINKKICPSGLPNNSNRPMEAIKWITIHNTGNFASSATANAHADYLYSGSGTEQISWHYTVDQDEIWQSFEDDNRCWHAGSTAGNDTSIGIEICVNSQSGFPDACKNAAWLVAHLLAKHNLTIDKVVQHNKWSGKDCPQQIRTGTWGVTWDGFISQVKDFLTEETQEDMTKEQFKDFLTEETQEDMTKEQFKEWFTDEMNQYKKVQASRPAMQSLTESWNEATELGIADGSRPYSFSTRQETATMILRASQLFSTNGQ